MTKREHHGILGACWQYSGDVNMLEYGGRFIRHVVARRYHVIEFTNMDDACGRDNEGNPPYVVELREVDLDACDVRGAAQSCGFETTDADGHLVWGDQSPAIASERISDIALAEMCSGHGAYAPLADWTGTNGWRMIRQARTESVRLERDAAEYEARMSRPVNRLGSTAREFMTGDLDSAILRGLADGKPEAEIMARMGMLRPEAR